MVKATAATAVGLAAVLGIGCAACSSAGAKRASSTTDPFIAKGYSTSTTVGNRFTSPASVPPTSTTVAPTTTTAAPTTTTLMSGELISVTGTGDAANDVTIENDGQEVQHNDVPLPYSTTYPVSGGISMEAQTADGDSSASITCSITSGGQSLVSNTSTGPYAVVTCSYGF